MDCLQHELIIRYRHRVFFTHGVFAPSNPLLRQVLVQPGATSRRNLLVVSETGVPCAQPDQASLLRNAFAALAPHVQLVAPPLLLEGGESLKNSLDPVHRILAAIHQHHIDRHSYVVALGGGALLDVAGFATAAAHRGCRHVRLPTTTLAQADSGVGVKNGINAFGKKNFLGTFAPPFAIINDLDFLHTLTPRDRRAGLAEAVKVALIRDATFFAWLEAHARQLATGDPAHLETCVRRCAELHLQHIATSGDPFEFSSARPLDFGHWCAHRLEQLSGFNLRHGEAVALGLALDTLYSQHAGHLPSDATTRVLSLLRDLGFTLWTPELQDPGLGGGLDDFREHLGGELTLTLLRGIGDAFETHTYDLALLPVCLDRLRSST